MILVTEKLMILVTEKLMILATGQLVILTIHSLVPHRGTAERSPKQQYSWMSNIFRDYNILTINNEHEYRILNSVLV